MQLFIRDLGLQVDAAPLFRVVHPAEAGHVDHALLVHVHVAGCESRRQRVSWWVAGKHPQPVFWLREQKWKSAALSLDTLLWGVADIKHC